MKRLDKIEKSLYPQLTVRLPGAALDHAEMTIWSGSDERDRRTDL